MINFFRKNKTFLILTCIVVLANIAFTVISYTQLKERLHKEEEQLAKDYFAAFNLAYRSTRTNMLQTANLFAHNPEYQKLFLEGKRAVEREGGGAGKEQAEKARDNLYNAVTSNWQHLNEAANIRVLQFHLAPGSTSFLRVHKPQSFGDNMDSIRHTIVDTNKYQQALTGFETGRVYSVIRGTSPVSIINNIGEIEPIGTVEAGTSFSVLFENLLSEFDVNAAVILSESHLRKNLWPDVLDKIIKESPLINGLFIEKTTSEQIKPLMISNTNHYHSASDISIKILTLENRDYLYATQPLRDYLAEKNDDAQSNVGHIIIWQDITEFYSEFNHSLLSSFTYGLLTFLLMELMLFWAIRSITNQLNKTIGQQKDQQQKLELIAHYDPLTNLANRALFKDRFIQATAHRKHSKALLAICYFDLDHFKPINDNFGHEVGDQILRKVAKRLQSIVRDGDTVSRYGGDEFALLLTNFHSSLQYIKLLKRIHNALAMPYLVDGVSHMISASSGTTFYPIDNANLDTLLRHANQAMYQAKLVGRNSYHFYDASDAHKVIQHQIKLQEIKQALVHDELHLYYQPKVNMRTGEIFGAEALIRWIHPERGLIPPGDFLPIIENTELELEIGDWVVANALAQLNNWHQHDLKLEVSVNISSYHLQSPSFIEHLTEALALYPSMNSQYFQLEILESSALGDVQAISQLIRSCQQELGVHVALDDFGTGYSSLTHLRNLSVNTIKIDQSFVRTMLDDPNDFSIIDGLISLAGAFNRDILAEGVESSKHGLMLMIMGCQSAQGYGISRPMPADEFPEWLNNYKPNEEWLEYGKLNIPLRERRIKLVQLTTHYWFNQFTHKLKTAQEKGLKEWPYIKHTKCHHGAWLKRAYKERLFDKDWLASLEVDHEAMHAAAERLIHRYQSGITDVSEDFKQVHIAFDKMIVALDNYK